MAMDPNEEVPQFTGYIDDPDQWPSSLPEGVTKDPAVWYAHRRTYGDGRTVWEFRKRNSGDGPVGENGKPGDKIVATVPGTPIKSVKEAYDKDKEKADDDAKPPGGLPERTVNGQVFRWNPQTRAYDTPTGQAPAAPRSPEQTRTDSANADKAQEEARNVQKLNWERDWHEKQGHGRYTHAEWEQKLDKDKAEALAQGNQARANQLADERIKWEKERANLPDIKAETIDIDGQKVTRVTVVHKDGRVEVKNIGADGKPLTTLPTPGAAAKNVDEFVPDYTQPDLGLGKWGAAQRQKIGKPAEAGGITQADYDKAATAAHQQAQVTIQNVTSNQQVTRQRSIDEQTQKQKLSDQSAADYGQAQGVFNDLWKYTKPGSRAIMDVIPGVMAEQKRYRSEREGQATSMPPLHPMFTNMATAAGVKPPGAPAASGPTPPVINAQTAAPSGVAAGLSAPPPAPVAAAAVPAPAPVAPVQGPNPATPNLYPPPPPAPATAPAASALQPPNPATPNLAPTLPEEPPRPAGPPSPVMSTDPLPPGQEELPLPPTGALPAGVVYPSPNPVAGAVDPNRMVWVRQSTGDGRLQQMPYSDFQAGAAQYGWVEVSDPSAIPGVDPGLPPITMAPQQGPVTAWANNLVQPQQQPSQQPVNPALQTAQAGAAQPAAYDPYQTGGKLAAWGVPPELISQAIKELGMIA